MPVQAVGDAFGFAGEHVLVVGVHEFRDANTLRTIIAVGATGTHFVEGFANGRSDEGNLVGSEGFEAVNG